MFHQVGKGYVSLAYTLIPLSNPSDDDYEIDHSNGNNEEIVITTDDKCDIYYINICLSLVFKGFRRKPWGLISGTTDSLVAGNFRGIQLET